MLLPMVHETIKDQIAEIPNKPGVYFFFNTTNDIIYIGKSVNLKKRVTDHFRDKLPDFFKLVKREKKKNKMPKHTYDYTREWLNERPSFVYNKERKKKIRIMNETVKIKYIVTNDDEEAFTLEGCVLSALRPSINRSFWDYPYIQVTINEEIPRVLIKTFVFEPDSYLFGPFNVDSGIEEAMKGFLRIIPICNYENKIKPGRYPSSCIRHQLQRCLAPCMNQEVDMKQYHQYVEQFIFELENLGTSVIKNLHQQMEKEIQEEQFESAAVLRDFIKNIQRAFKQKAMPTILDKYYIQIMEVIENRVDYKQIIDKILDNNNGCK
jgi:excinuclease ABC subunit C